MCNSNIHSIILFSSNLHSNKATWNQSSQLLLCVEVVQVSSHSIYNVNLEVQHDKNDKLTSNEPSMAWM